MKKLLTSAALVALLATPALAEDATTMGKQPPAAAETQAPAMQGEAPAMQGEAPAANPANPPADTADAPAATPEKVAPPAAVAGDMKFIPEQATGEQLASTWIGKSVYNSADENLGDINDIIVSADGKVDGVILGVGGFLGLGEKNVAIAFSDIKATTDADGRVKLTLNATREQLDAAPEFMSLADKQAKARSEAPATESPAGPAAPAPAQ